MSIGAHVSNLLRLKSLEASYPVIRSTHKRFLLRCVYVLHIADPFYHADWRGKSDQSSAIKSGVRKPKEGPWCQSATLL